MLKSSILPLLLLFSCAYSLKFLQYQNTTYDVAIANASWYFCGASYCKPSNIQTWAVSTAAVLYPNVQSIHVFINSTGDNLGYSAYDPNTDKVILVFRGSDNIENWAENLDFVQMGYSYCSGCEVHAGFFGAYKDIQADVISNMKSLRQQYPSSQLIVTGHSLGAAIATLAYVDLYAAFGSVDYLYTFGSPRVGNDQFASYVSQQLDQGFKARITHYEDLIPHLPFYDWGFTHIDREVFYDTEDSSSYVLCKTGEEDPNCSYQYSLISTSVSDHQNYMGFDKETMQC